MSLDCVSRGGGRTRMRSRAEALAAMGPRGDMLRGGLGRVLRWLDEETCDVRLGAGADPAEGRGAGEDGDGDGGGAVRARWDRAQQARFPRMHRAVCSPGALVILDTRHRIVSGLGPARRPPAG